MNYLLLLFLFFESVISLQSFDDFYGLSHQKKLHNILLHV